MSELEKSRKWLRQANAEYDDPLKVFGTLIAEFMDAEPTLWAMDHSSGKDLRDVISSALYGHRWQPALFGAIAKSTAFIMLVPNQLGDWQKIEYYEARDRKAKDDDYMLLFIIVADKTKGPAANLPGLAQLHWIETTEPAAPEPLSRIVAALQSGPKTA